ATCDCEGRLNLPWSIHRRQNAKLVSFHDEIFVVISSPKENANCGLNASKLLLIFASEIKPLVQHNIHGINKDTTYLVVLI
ncbi:unnamed protein product, partial [Dovyalis caffra]